VIDFLSFEYFITPQILIVFYYMGVFFLPFIVWKYRKKLTSFYQSSEYENKLIVLLILIFIFCMMQLFWRMMFEMMIGYFDIHNYLHDISQQGL